MDLALWIVAGVLATVLLVSTSKMFVPREKMAMRLRRGEKATIVADMVYLAMAVFVAWGRFDPESFTG
jgi:hypothetical protein